MTLSRLMTILFPLFDTPGDGAGGATGAGGAAPVTEGAAGATAAGTAASGSAGDGQARTGAAPTGQPSFSYKEDRSKWIDPSSGQYIPKHRFDEVNTQAQRARELEAAVAERDRKIAALAGVSTPDPASAKAEQIKEAFFALPGMGVMKKLAALSEEQLDKLLQVPQHVDRAAEAEARGWQRHGNEQVQYIGDKVAEALGVDKLDAGQLEDIRPVFSSWLKKQASNEIQQTGKSETIRRYEDGDPTLLDEFATAYTKRWVEPARRTATATTFNRVRPVPSSTGRAAVSSVQRPAEFKTLDERIEYAANLAKERGVQFGR